MNGLPGIELVERLSLFSSLSRQDLTELLTRARVSARKPGEVVVEQGDHADSVYVVLSGEARVELDGAEVDPPIREGECLGELAVLDGVPRAATVIALTPLTLLEFAADSFAQVLEDFPELRLHVRRALTARLRQVSMGWAQLAVDIDVLLESYFALQSSTDQGDRRSSVQAAADLLRRMAAHPSSVVTPLDALTPAERKVSDLVARGLSNAAVAAELVVSEHTVASHLKHIYVKLGLSSRVELAGAVLRAQSFHA